MPGAASEFMASSPRATGANTSWAEGYGAELRGIVTRYASQMPRNVQRHLGPSEIGAVCDRQVIGKMAGSRATNHVADPWASVVGTAIHAYLAEAFNWDNEHNGYLRWLAEQRVTPDPGPDPHPGTADLYDADNRAVVDHKCLGDSSRAKLKAKGPPRHYFVQLMLYRRGYLNIGFPVDRIVIAAWPRTKSYLDDMYVWAHAPTAADDQLVDDVLTQTAFRQQAAALVRAGKLNLMDITPEPDDDSCYFCFLYRPQAAFDGGYGCPGTVRERRN